MPENPTEQELVLDLDAVKGVLNKLDEMIEFVEGGRWPVTYDGGETRYKGSDRAMVARALLNAQTLADLLKAEVGVLYWQLSGFNDPRKD